MRQSLFFVAAVAICVSCVAQEVGPKKIQAQSEPAIQKRIGKVYDALNQSSRDHRYNIEVLHKIAELRDSVADKGEIVKQMAIFASGPTSDEHRPLLVLMILDLLDPSPKVVIPALAPYLNAENKKLRSFARDWFQAHDNGGTDETKLKPVNFEDYADYVRKGRQGGNLPTAFVQYIYERSPNRAFLIFVRTDRQSNAVKGLEAIRKKMEQQGANLNKLPRARAGVEKNELLLAEHKISNAIWIKKYYFDDRFPEATQLAKHELDKLAERDEWWARLYVAEIMRRNRELRLPDVLDRLSRDSNALVSKSAKSSRE